MDKPGQPNKKSIPIFEKSFNHLHTSVQIFIIIWIFEHQLHFSNPYSNIVNSKHAHISHMLFVTFNKLMNGYYGQVFGRRKISEQN